MADHRALIEELKEFARARQRGIGASDMPGVLNLGGDWSSPLKVYADKVAGPDARINDAQLWGHLHEPTVAAEYERRTGTELYKPEPFMPHPEHPELFANLDRKVRGADRTVEIKTTSEWKGWGSEGSDEIPLGYGIQTQFQMAITGEPELDVAVLIGGNDFRIYTVKADGAAQRQLVQIGIDFWQRVQRRIQPPPDWSHPETANAIARLYKPVEKKELAVDPVRDLELVNLGHELAMVKSDLKERKAREDELKSRIAMLMGDCAIALFPGGMKITRSVIRKKAYTVNPQEYVELRLTPAKGEA